MAGLLLRGPEAHPQAWRGGPRFVPGLGEIRGQIQVSTKDRFLKGRVVQPQRSVSLSLGRHAAERDLSIGGGGGQSIRR